MNSEMLTVVLLLAAVFIILTVVNAGYQQINQDYTTETAFITTGTDSELVRGVFVRDEQVLTYDKKGVISYEVADGGKLGIGSVIANVYSSENQIEIKQRISALENELYLLGRISNPGTTQTAQPTSISELFNQNYKTFLYSREQSDLSALKAQREEMVVLLSTYQLVTGKDSGYQERMDSIRSEIESLELAREEPLDVITAEDAAYFVSYADGYEDELTMKGIKDLTADMLEGVRDRTDDDPKAIGKLIDSYQWALAAVVDNSEKRYQLGDHVTLKFASTSETVAGEVTMLNSDAGAQRTVIAVTCENMTYDLVQHRTENVDIIRGEYQGIMVPRGALHFRTMTDEVTDPETGETKRVSNAYRGVYILDGEQPEFRKLDVIYEGVDYVISAEREDSSYLHLYDAIITKGIDADGE
ncbi:MAG: hypothetical protein IJ055_09455 [Oscillospiraceae bacterium]|nr:hypothetical protein [Oscillospiraceae bacterium]